ncbi:MAG TPA: amidohydrolase family protein [Xanthobacteraceae bacterium]|nr:amidohydrolase family protein [Xanthobacteraceae bacterium]
MTTTVIRNSDWIVAFDAGSRGHRYVSGDVAFANDKLIHVGGKFAGPADREIDGRGFMVMPGLVNIHSHPASEPLNKGWNDEAGSAKLYNSSLYEIMPIFRPDKQGVAPSFRVALCEALMSGVTTLVDLSVAHEGWVALMAASGMRGVLGPMYRSARWYTRNGHVVEYEWDEAAGRRAMDEALRVIAAAQQHPSGRLSGMVIPSQIDTCSAELFRDSYAESLRLKVPFQTHAAQSIVEFHEMTRRHGMTPIEWLDSLGVLGPTSIIGHGIFLDHHSAAHWPKRDDLKTIIDRGVTVAHCPTVFIRRGITMQTVGGYIRRGVKIAIGTDTYPHNMIEEMRHALYASRIVARDVFDLRTRDIFNAATLGGAAALQRDDIGRLAVGAKADIVLVDVTAPSMRPVRDPIQSLIYQAADRAVRHVFVDGAQVVADGRVTTMDYAAAALELEETQRRVEPMVRELDWAHRSHEELSPLVYRRAH